MQRDSKKRKAMKRKHSNTSSLAEVYKSAMGMSSMNESDMMDMKKKKFHKVIKDSHAGKKL